MDVGAGNGILSLFALQAGAKLVFAVEASTMVEHLHHLVRAAHAQDGDSAPNMWTRDRLAVVHARVEDVTPGMLREAAPIPVEPRVDTIVSECLGVLLVHERMCETLLEARDRFLKPDGAVFPRVGILCFSLLNDARMWQEAVSYTHLTLPTICSV